jgi:acyl-CoA synthetase (AMP-forming)/AMP-acid ligase II
MAVATAPSPSQIPWLGTVSHSHSTPATVEIPQRLNTISDLLSYQAKHIPDAPIIAYPGSDYGSSDFVEYTAKQLDQFADLVAHGLTKAGLRPSVCKLSPSTRLLNGTNLSQKAESEKAEVVALLGPSNFEYIIALLAISRMGFSVFFLSTRLPTEAYTSLLESTQCTRIVYSSKCTAALANIQQNYALQSFSMPDKSSWIQPSTPVAKFHPQTKLAHETDTVAFIVHSSGSTGLPKPIYQTHRQCLSNYAVGSGMCAFVTLPLFHNHGLATTFRGIMAGKRTTIYNANLPLTNGHLVAAMTQTSFDSFHCVPYALKVLAETDDGVAQLAKAKLVLFGGSSCPDELGDLLVENGVNLVSHYGA